MKIITDENKIEEILTRGTEDIIEKESLKKRLLSGKKLNIKLGIDPTGPKIHLGRATILMKLRDFQDLGHNIILIIGNFTALIGDASDKDAMRKVLTEKEIKENVKDYLNQIGKILDIKKVQVKYNKDWLGKIKPEEFIQLAMNFTAQQMIQRRNFKERWDKESPIGLHELMYPLLQGYDSVAIKSDVEIGGFDQLFNLKAGRVLQRAFNQEPQDVMTFRMIYGLDGRKMSTSWGNVINILDEPVDMFGKLMTLKDELMIDYFESCTRIPMIQIEEIKKSLKNKEVNPKEIKKALAKEIVTIFHNSNEAQRAQEEFEQVFEDKKLPTEIEEVQVENGEHNAQELLIKLSLAKSKSDAKRLLEQGGVKTIINTITEVVKTDNIKTEKGMIIQVGKRNFRKII
ncbi:MAG: tyrosine--tRNA ligase [Candidatus Pacebacteria bacterium]|nr:tyrosine--tRNA ligase [Candidatus Paceibacterota bacterium]MDD2757135.1 tyrosine--tRNA ligase [Candidatus Paceibacterota bacterium]MDD3283594.1 tyrosine--tRNA ligase [Candidatus Paceibacterota bacterium]MDD3969783.1 tyrosine--tRNA ligase [Candidatus Paceibacterota bacterium]MDD4737993.1 tyrosine--tRNA ligase [Candidatus Paceibacterota bacterium]